MSSDIENIDRQIVYHTDRAEGRTNEIDPATGERKYAYDEPTRKRSALVLAQLKQTREYQVQANARVANERIAAEARTAQRQAAHAAEQQTILDRAKQIRIERQALKLANSGADLDALDGRK